MQFENTKPLAALFGDVVDRFGTLVRSETRVAKAELSEKVAEAGRGIGYIALAAILMIPAAVMLLLALALSLVQMGLTVILSYLIAAAIGAAFSIILVAIGLSRLKPKNFRLTRTMDQVDKDLVVVKDLAR